MGYVYLASKHWDFMTCHFFAISSTQQKTYSHRGYTYERQARQTDTLHVKCENAHFLLPLAIVTTAEAVTDLVANKLLLSRVGCI